VKTRQGFVTNSSSSSFIVLCNTRMMTPGFGLGKIVRIGDSGEIEFGWENEKYTDFYDKLNFAALQILEAERCGDTCWYNTRRETWRPTLEKALRAYAGFDYVEWVLTNKYPVPDGMVDGYIDHQSSAAEGKNTEIFASYETLCDFLFSKDSYIQGGNDNE